MLRRVYFQRGKTETVSTLFSENLQSVMRRSDKEFLCYSPFYLEIHEFRRNFDDVTRSERRRAIARWKARTFLKSKMGESARSDPRVATLDARKREN